MAISSIGGSSQQLNVSSSIQTAVSAKVLDSQRTEDAAAIKLLQASTVPATSSTSGSSKSVDVKA